MKISKVELPNVVFCIGSIVFFVLLVVSSGLFRHAALVRGQIAGRQRLLDSAKSECDQLRRYETIRERLGALPPESSSDSSLRGLLPDTVPDSDSHSFHNLEIVDGFQGRQADLTWKALDKHLAFQILSILQSDKNAVWHVVEMKMDALPDEENVSLHLLLETARVPVE